MRKRKLYDEFLSKVQILADLGKSRFKFTMQFKRSYFPNFMLRLQ